MLSKTESQFSFLFTLLLIAELICGSVESLASWHYFTKPSLLTALIVYFYYYSKHNSTTKTMILLALVFSLMGDVFLMFVEVSANYFMFGLVSFFLTHVFYILVFWKRRNSTINATGLMAILGLYAIGFFYLLKNHLSHLLIPVIFYIMIILTMVLTAFLRQKEVSKK